MHRHLRHDRHCRLSDHEKKPAYTAVSLHNKIGVLETTMYADSVFSESGGSDQYQMKDLIPDSILTYHVRSIRSAPSASRAIPGLSSGERLLGSLMGIELPRRISTGRPAPWCCRTEVSLSASLVMAQLQVQPAFWILIAFLAPLNTGSWRAGHRMLAVKTKVPDEGIFSCQSAFRSILNGCSEAILTVQK